MVVALSTEAPLIPQGSSWPFVHSDGEEGLAEAAVLFVLYFVKLENFSLLCKILIFPLL